MNEPMVPVSEAYKIGDRMARPWAYATLILAFIAGYLLYIIQTAEVEATADVTADTVTANQISSKVNVKE